MLKEKFSNYLINKNIKQNNFKSWNRLVVDPIEIPIPSPAQGVGSGPDLERERFYDRGRRIIFLPVKNRLTELNTAVHAPFNLSIGEQTPFGLFAYCPDSDIDSFTGDLPKDSVKMEVLHRHNRSALFSRLIFSDEDGRVYRDLDLKGIGLIGKEWIIPAVYNPGGKTEMGDVLGFVEKDWALHDYLVSEEFLALGIRAHRVLGIVEIDEYISAGSKKKFNGFFKQLPAGMNRNYKPVIEVRAFGTRARIINIWSPEEVNSMKETLIDDAKKLVSAELGRESVMTDDEFLLWFAKNLGRNVGKMHANGWSHGFLTEHNITLDCRLTDFDSAEAPASTEQMSLDFSTAQESLRHLYNAIKSRSKSRNEEFTKIFNQENDFENVGRFGSSIVAKEFRKAYQEEVKDPALLLIER